MNGMPEWAVYGVPAVIWIVALINWLKETFDLDTRWTLPIATVLAGLIGTALYFSETVPWVKVATQMILGAVLVGLAASGYYSGTKAQVERNKGR